MLLRASHPLFYAAISVLLWSSLATMARALGHIPPFLLLAWTFLIGCLLGIKHWKSWLANYRLTLFGTAGIFGYHFFLFSAFRNAPAIEANLINYLWPILMVLLSPLFIPAFKLRTNALLGSLIAFSGACLIVTGGKFNFQAEYLTGYLLALGAAITWAVYSLITKRLPPFPTTAVGGFCLGSAVLSALFHVLFEPRASIQSRDLLAVLLLGIGPMGIAFYTWDSAIKRGDPARISSLSYLTPLLSTFLLAWFGEGRELKLTSLIALVLILAGAVLSAWKPRRVPPTLQV